MTERKNVMNVYDDQVDHLYQLLARQELCSDRDNVPTLEGLAKQLGIDLLVDGEQDAPHEYAVERLYAYIMGPSI